jgi:hypothetical protein
MSPNVQIIFVLVDLADKEAATPVLNFFALTTEETKVAFLLGPVVSHLYIKFFCLLAIAVNLLNFPIQNPTESMHTICC